MIIAVHEAYEEDSETQIYFLDLDKVDEPFHTMIVNTLSSKLFTPIYVEDMEEYEYATENAFVDLPALVEGCVYVWGR